MKDPTNAPQSEICASAGMRMITREQRERAITIALVNEDRAAVCSPQQSALAQVFRINAAFLREIAQ